ncbi:melatonin receptor type 1C-like [Montipora foliosa]|uniref:melatonin receptor type 1C-like n=1 Tax=Montipora foliosa TaxID=591990 RepID=UPI0035F150AC
MAASLNEYPNLKFDLSNRGIVSKIMEPLVLTFLIIIAFVGNGITCAAVCKYRRLRTLPNMFVTNLAVSDILMSIIVMPISLKVFISSEWPFGPVVCDLQGFFIFSFAIVSQGNMAAIAVNRYFAVCRPIANKIIFTRRNIMMIIALLWILPSIASVPPLVGWGYYVFHPGKAICIYPFDVNMTYTALVALLFIGLPMGLIVFSYIKCFFAIRSSNHQIAQMDDNRRRADQECRKWLEIRSTLTMMKATLGFILCWLPVSVIAFIDVSTGGDNLPRQVFTFTTFLVFLSSTINLFIYWLSNRDYQRAFRNVFRCAEESVVIDTSRPQRAHAVIPLQTELTEVPAIHK